MVAPASQPARALASATLRVSRAAAGVLVVVGLGIAVIGAWYLLGPTSIAAGFGVSSSPGDPFLAVKGVRDIGSGLMLLVALGVGGPRVGAWVALAATTIPLGDMTVVLVQGGPLATALGVHGVTGVLIAVAAAILLLGSRGADAR